MLIKTLCLLQITAVVAWTSCSSPTLSRSNRSQPCFALLSDIESGNIENSMIMPFKGNEDMIRKEGENIIKTAVGKVGANVDKLSIDWKGGKIIVTVEIEVNDNEMEEYNDQQTITSEVSEDELLNGELEDRLMNGDLEDELINDDGDELQSSDDFDFQNRKGPLTIDVIARAINAALIEDGEESIGYCVAFHHAIEVTTPGRLDEFSGIMFEAYKGFDVIMETIDAKTKKRKRIEGRLMGRTEEHTIINMKGRKRNFLNRCVLSVKLPKAKKEKRK